MLKTGQRVVELGCWPGGWLQVAASAVGVRGRVVGVDLAEIDPPFDNENVVALLGDLSDPALPDQILESLGGLADVLLSDAAPNLTGIRVVDRAAEESLLAAVESLVPALLRAGGDLLVKLLESPEAQAAARRIGARFAKARTVKPAATRKGSSERYLLARNFRG